MATQHFPRIRIDDLPPIEQLTEEEMARILGAGRPKRPSLGVESLETRELMAANALAVFANGMLRVEGTEGADRLVVRQVENEIKVDGIPITDASGNAVSAPLAGVSKVQIDALGGNDVIWIADNLNLPVEARGGAGVDAFFAGPQTTLSTDREAAERLVSTAFSPVYQQLENAAQNLDGTYSLGSLSLGAFTLTNVKATITSEELFLEADANLPAVKGVHLSGKVAHDGSTYSLSTSPSELSLGQFKLTNAVTTLSEKGLSVSGDANIELLGKVTFTGTIDNNGNYTLGATLKDKSLLGGLIEVKSMTLALSGDTVSIVESETKVAKLGSANFKGSISASGSYVVKATAGIDVAGFKVQGAELTLGSEEVDVLFSMPIEGIGDVEFGGSYGPNGWSVKGTYPYPVTLGPVVLKNIGVEIASNKVKGDSVTVSALGTIAGIEGLVDAKATATVYSDGRIDMNLDATALKLAGFSLGKATVTLSNNNPQRLWNTTIDGVVGIPGSGAEITLKGYIDAKGNYFLEGKQTLAVAGVTLSEARFELTKAKGLTFGATYNYLTYKVEVTGSATADGRITFEGKGGTAKLPNGFSLGEVSVKADLNRPANRYTMHIEGKADVLIATVKFTADVTGNGTSFSSPVLTGEAEVSGAVAKLFTGKASFTIKSDRVSFEGKLGIKNAPGATVSVSGHVKSDGSVKIGNFSTTTQDLRKIDTPGEAIVALWNMTGQLSDITKVLNAFSLDNVASALNHAFTKLGASWVGNALWQLSWDRMIGAMGKMSIGNVGSILETYKVSRIYDTLSQAFSKLGTSWVRDALWQLSWDKMVDVMGKMSISRVGSILEGWGVSRIYDTLDRAFSRLGTSWVRDALWQLSWDKMIDTMGKMSISRVGSILEGWSVDRIFNTLDRSFSRLGTGWVRDALWQLSWDKMIDSMGKMSISRVGSILEGWGVSRIYDTLERSFSRLGTGWVRDALWQLSWDKMIDAMGRMSISRVGSVLEGWSTDRIFNTLERSFSRLGTGWVKDALWQLSWGKMMGALERMSFSRIVNVVGSYDSGKMWATLDHMSSGLRTRVMQALGLPTVSAGNGNVTVSGGGASVSVGTGGVSASVGNNSVSISTSGSSVSVGGRRFRI